MRTNNTWWLTYTHDLGRATTCLCLPMILQVRIYRFYIAGVMQKTLGNGEVLVSTWFWCAKKQKYYIFEKQLLLQVQVLYTVQHANNKGCGVSSLVQSSKTLSFSSGHGRYPSGFHTYMSACMRHRHLLGCPRAIKKCRSVLFCPRVLCVLLWRAATEKNKAVCISWSTSSH